MKYLANKFSKPGGRIASSFSGRFLIAEACSELQLNCGFVGCDVDAECFAARMAVRVETYARRVQNKKLYIPGNEEKVDACKIMV